MSATIPAPHAERIRSRGGQRRRGRDGGGRRAAPDRDPDAGRLRNAMMVLQAIGGSTNGLIHLTAIAGRTEHRID